MAGSLVSLLKTSPRVERALEVGSRLDVFAAAVYCFVFGLIVSLIYSFLSS